MSSNRGVKSRSIRTRLLTGYALVLLASMLIISVYLYIQVEQNLVQTMKSILRTEFQATVESLGTHVLDPTTMSNFLSRQTMLGKGPYRLNYALFDETAHVIARTEGFSEDIASVQAYQPKIQYLDAEVFPPFETTVRSGKGQRVFLITAAFLDRSEKLFYLQFGLDESGISKNMDTLMEAIFLAIPVILVLALSGGFLLTRRLLKPINNLSKAAREITITNLDKKLPVAGTGDELDELAITFNEVFARLRESYQRIIRFTADASHELRLPITAIKGEAEVVLSRERGLEEYRKVLADIIEEFNRLSRMVNQLLALSRTDSGEEPLEYEEVDLKDVLAKLVDFYQPLAEEKQITLSFEGQSAGFVKADRMKIQELFSNLLENAIKYTNSSGSITVRLKSDGEKILASVADTGIGIPKSEQSKIFERFYRVDKSRSRDQGGVGLGLSIADAIARAHGSKISVESEAGKGSIFTVAFPS